MTTKRLIHILGYSTILFTWFVVVFLCLELWERWNWRQIEKNNKYIKIRRGELPYWLWEGEVVHSVQYGEGKDWMKLITFTVGEEFCVRVLEPLETWNYRFHEYFRTGYSWGDSFKKVYEIKEIIFKFNRHNGEKTVFALDPDDSEIQKYSNWINALPTNFLTSGRSVITEHNDGERNFYLYLYPDGCDQTLSYFKVFIFPTRNKKEWNPLVDNTTLIEINEIPYFSNLPHISSSISPYRTNNFGFRDKDFVVPKPTNVFRIICIGASTTEEGISNKETYPKFLEEKLLKHFNNYNIEVFNCGISGMMFEKHLARIPDYLFLQPDMVIMYEGINDIVYELFPRLFDGYPTPIRFLLIFSQYFRKFLHNTLPYSSTDIQNELDRLLIHYVNQLYLIFNQEGIDFCIASIGVPYRDKLSPIEQDYYDYYYNKEWGGANSNFELYCTAMRMFNEKLREFCRKNGILYIPVEENMPPSIRYFGDICHMRQDGIKLKAKIMADTLIPYLEQKFSAQNLSPTVQ